MAMSHPVSCPRPVSASLGCRQQILIPDTEMRRPGTDVEMRSRTSSMDVEYSQVTQVQTRISGTDDQVFPGLCL